MPPYGRRLHSNRLSGTIPAAIGNLTALTTLCAHSRSIPLSPILPPPASLPFSPQVHDFQSAVTQPHMLHGIPTSTSEFHLPCTPRNHDCPPCPPSPCIQFLPLPLCLPPCLSIHQDTQQQQSLRLHSRCNQQPQAATEVGPPKQHVEWHHSLRHCPPHRTHLPVRPFSLSLSLCHWTRVQTTFLSEIW
ncbi:unnamed protein product [Closterium sp. NIES-54]